jgi:hypothetical protein
MDGQRARARCVPEVRTTFEPNRLERDALRIAYECVLPACRHALGVEAMAAGMRRDESAAAPRETTRRSQDRRSA